MARTQTNKKATLRVGIIGCGAIGSASDEGSKKKAAPKTHAKAFWLNRNVELVALCDVSKSRVGKAQKVWGVPFATTDIDEFLGQNLDIVSLCSPVDVQYANLKKVLASKVKVVLCEKPIGRDAEEFRDIAELVERASAVVAVNYSRRYDENLNAIKLELSRGKMGSPQKIVGHYGKGLLNNGSHLIDLLNNYFGLPQYVQAVEIIEDDRAQSIDPTVAAILYYSKGFAAYLTAQNHLNYSVFEIDAMFEKGRIVISHSGQQIETFKVKPDAKYKGYHSLYSQSVVTRGLENTFSNAAAEMVAIAKGQTGASCTIVDTVGIHLVVDAILESTQTGFRRVIVKDLV